MEVIPTNRPMIRVDHPDAYSQPKQRRNGLWFDEIRQAHATGQPVLVGTASIAESEALSRFLTGIPHRVLNAKNDEVEAAIIAEAGQRGAVTISTNMAGRGTDIQLGEGVAALGGLYVIGTNKHESRRIDDQLRGRAGRQGDPGCSRFFISLEDELMTKYGDINPRYSNDPDNLQRLVEGQTFWICACSCKVRTAARRASGIASRPIAKRSWMAPSLAAPELERKITFELWTTSGRTIWSAWRICGLACNGSPWGGEVLILRFLKQVDQWFPELEEAMPREIERRMAQAEAGGGEDLTERGAVWTYVTTDQPFGTWTERILRGFRRKFKNRDFWG